MASNNTQNQNQQQQQEPGLVAGHAEYVKGAAEVCALHGHSFCK